MTAYSIRPSTETDLRYLSENLRKADVKEIEAALGPDADVLDALKRSSPSLVGCADGTPVIIFGERQGAVWALATDELLRHRREFLRASREWLDSFDKELVAFPWAGNSVHHRWLEWAGFKRGAYLANFSYTGEKFIHYYRPKNVR